MSPVYTPNPWTDDDGTGTTGTTISAARMNAIEQAVAEASLRTRIVRGASLVNVPLTGRPTGVKGGLVDGLIIGGGDRVLLAGQTNPIENGVYLYSTSGFGANQTYTLSYDTDWMSASQVRTGQVIYASEGTFNGQRQFLVATDLPTPGVTPVTILAGAQRIPLLTALPDATTVADGMVADFMVDSATGIIWRLRFRATSPSGFKWEVVGSGEYVAYGAGGYSVAAGGGLFGPTLTVPLAGDYVIRFGGGVVSGSGRIAMTQNGAGLSFTNADLQVPGVSSGIQVEPRTLVAGGVLRMIANNGWAGGGGVYDAYIEVQALRVG